MHLGWPLQESEGAVRRDDTRGCLRQEELGATQPRYAAAGQGEVKPYGGR